MPANEIELGISTAQAEAKIEALRQKVAQLRAEMTALGNAIGGGTASPEQLQEFRGGLTQIGAAQGALDMLQGSAGKGVSGGQTTASAFADAAVGGAAIFGGPSKLKNVPFGDPAGAFSAMQNLLPGLTTPAQFQIGQAMNNGGMPLIPNMNVAAMVTGMVQMAQSSPVAAMPIDRTLVMPQAMAATLARTQMIPLDQTQMMSPVQMAQGGGAGTGGGMIPFMGGGRSVMAIAALGAITETASTAFEIGARNIVSGNRDYNAEVRLAAQVLGGSVGAAIGFGYGGPGPALLGGAAGMAVAGAISDNLMASRTRALGVGEAVRPLSGMWGEEWGVHSATMPNPIPGMLFGNYGTGGTARRTERLINLAESAGSKKGGPWEGLKMSPKEFAETWASASEAMIQGGLDPRTPTGFDSPSAWGHTGDADIRRGGEASRSYIGQSWIATGLIKNATSRVPGVPGMELGEKWAYELDYIFGSSAPGVKKMTDPILATLPETGGNMLDVLMKYGPQATKVFSDIAFKVTGSIPPTSIENLTDISGVIRGGERELGFARTRARGGGAAAVGAYDTIMDAMRGIPGGADSLAYAQVGAARRGAVAEAFGEYAGAEYELPLMRTEGALRRARMAPFMPGYTFGLELSAMAQRTAYGRALGTYREQRRKRGELSVGEELGIEEQMQNLQTENMAGVATLAEGGPNLMAGLSAGAPAGFRRFDAMQLAALRIGQAGHPRRAYGAMGGRQARMQDEFVESFGMGHMDPISRSGVLGGQDMGRVVQLLERIAGSLERGGGSFGKPRRGSADLAPSGGYVQTGNDAPWN